MTKQQRLSTQSRNPQKKSAQFFSRHRTDLIAIAILYVLTLILFRGIVFENAVFSTEGDTAAAQSWLEAGTQLHETEKVPILWMPYAFSGMPAFGSLAYTPASVDYLGIIIHFVFSLLFFNGTMAWMVQAYFFGGVSMYILLRILKQGPVASAIGAMIFMFNPYAVDLAHSGHGSKLLALMYLPALMLATHYLFEKRSWLSFGLFAAGVGTLLLTNHVQMAYYVFMVIGCYWIYTVIIEIKSQRKTVFTKSVLFWGGIILGFCVSAFVYLSVYEYSHFTLRSGSGMPGAAGGLTFEYATNWSFHPFETLTLLIPSFFGFQSPYYWGWMPFTETTNYFGLLPILLSIIALIYCRNRMTVFCALMAVLVLLMSFGKHFSVFYNILFHYLPFFSKFRSPAMILSLLPFIGAIFSAYGVSFLMTIFEKDAKFNVAKFKRRILITLGIIIGATILIALMKDSLYQTLSGSMFVKDSDPQQYTQQQISQLKQYRFEMLWKDIVRFTVFMTILLGTLFLYSIKSIGKGALVAILGLTFVVDIFLIDANYINPQTATDVENRFLPDATVTFLKKDAEEYRVFPLMQLFDDNTWMYHRIESIGGYSPAKLSIYQEMLDSALYRGWNPNFPLNMSVVNMLNVKYLIAPGRLPDEYFQLVNVDQVKRVLTYKNPGVLPRVFFVDTAIVIKEKSDLFRTLNSKLFNPAKQAILEKEPEGQPGRSDSTSIAPVAIHSQEMSYRVFTHTPALLVFSEVYYPDWKASIDGNEVRVYKTNYILRSIVVPAGEHTVLMKYESKMYSAGYAISLAAWAAVLLCVLGGGYIQNRKMKKGEKPTIKSNET
ncbi:MAG: hypothetical protein ABSB78_10485 [Bacteroidota bacterium]